MLNETKPCGTALGSALCYSMSLKARACNWGLTMLLKGQGTRRLDERIVIRIVIHAWV